MLVSPASESTVKGSNYPVVQIELRTAVRTGLQHAPSIAVPRDSHCVHETEPIMAKFLSATWPIGHLVMMAGLNPAKVWTADYWVPLNGWTQTPPNQPRFFLTWSLLAPLLTLLT